MPGWVSARPPRRSAQLVSRINASRVAGDAEQRVVESRLQLESDVRKLLREVSAGAEQALTNAREIMAAGENAVAAEFERLRNLPEELAAFTGES